MSRYGTTRLPFVYLSIYIALLSPRLLATESCQCVEQFLPGLGEEAETVGVLKSRLDTVVDTLQTEGTRRTKKSWPVTFTQEELRKRLTPIQYHVTQEKGTESAFRGEFADHKGEGIYKCVVCGAPLFTSDTKFDSGSGWPSFFSLIKEESVAQTDDFSFGMHRVETTCSQCGAHLGHLFDDGPRPTGKRYCMNSASLAFQPKEQTDAGPLIGAAARAPLNEDPAGAATPSSKTEL